MRRPRLVAAGSTVAGALAAYGLLFGQAKLARRAIGVTDARPPSADGLYGPDTPVEPVRLLLLGDSAAVGYGMDRAEQTPPFMLGTGLAHVLDRPVEVRSLAVVGAKTADVLDEQLPRIGDYAPHVTVIIVGTNDVTHQVPLRVSARQLGRVVEELVELGSEVVVGTTPDLGTIRPIMQPLRTWAQRQSRELARRQSPAVREAGGHPVPLAHLLGDLFRDRYDVMFGFDRFHPSEAGYANMVSVLLPAVAAAIGGREAHDSAQHLVRPSRRWHLPLRRGSDRQKA